MDRSAAYRSLLLFILGIGLPLALGQTKLLRHPDLHGERVVFTYAGDLWTASVNGGIATRLTAHPGLELFAKFSPDGQQIAFTGQYDGDEQVYVMPASGGIPRQLTFYPAKGPLPPRRGSDNQVYDWTPDGKGILFRSMRDHWTPAESRLFVVPLAGGLPKPLPMPVSGAGDFSPDMKRLVYSPLFRDFRAWKRYQGGWAQDLFIFDLSAHTLQPLANSIRTERDPMWMGDRICFASDRTGTLNLYEYDLASKRLRALTNSTTWDIRWPSKGDKTQIVYEMDGELWVLDARRGPPRKISILVPTDGLASRPSTVHVGGQIASFGLSPKGERALFVARGDVFTAPIEKGVVRNLTRSSGAHDKAPEWSPDGRRIVMISDRTGEEELFLHNQDGSGQPEQLTQGNAAMLYRPRWSPDSKRIAYSDKEGRVFVLTLEGRAVVQVADEARGQVLDYTWSPDSNWLAYSLTDDNEARSIWIWSVADNRARRVTSPLFEEANPAWDPEGDYLFYLSDREFSPIISHSEFNYATARMTSIYALALRKDVKHPFPPESDEVQIADEKQPAGAKPEDAQPGAGAAAVKPAAAEKKDKPLTIDFDGIEARVARVPLPAHNYSALQAIKGHLLFVRSGNPYYGREPDARPELVIYSRKDRKETVLVEGLQGYALSRDGAKFLAREQGGFALYDATPAGKGTRKPVSTAQLTVERIPSQEWTQIFNEVWRRYRDFFYVKNMHGYDWEALRRQYSPLLESVGHRSDLNYVLSEMVAELNVGHAYLEGGDWDKPPRPQVALPGAQFELEEASGRYRIAKIYRGHNEEPVYRSPLTEVGVDARVGDFVLAIDGVDLPAHVNPYQLLRGKAGKPVTFTLNARPDSSGARQVTFSPISTEEDLIYLEMVERNRERVAQATGGRAGYLHVPNMGAEGIREFIKWFYVQTGKEALVVDMRANGGGNVSRMLIERLRRQLLATGFARTSDRPSTYPDGVMIGPMVCLLNEVSASDGDIFPAMFREAKLGPLIGKRSWGGVVGITNRGALIDGGLVNVPEFGFASAKGEWIIEGEGVTPDIVVDNDPQSVIAGRDPQLERGIEEILQRLKEGARKLPPRPQDPVKTSRPLQ